MPCYIGGILHLPAPPLASWYLPSLWCDSPEVVSCLKHICTQVSLQLGRQNGLVLCVQPWDTDKFHLIRIKHQKKSFFFGREEIKEGFFVLDSFFKFPHGKRGNADLICLTTTRALCKGKAKRTPFSTTAAIECFIPSWWHINPHSTDACSCCCSCCRTVIYEERE